MNRGRRGGQKPFVIGAGGAYYSNQQITNADKGQNGKPLLKRAQQLKQKEQQPKSQEKQTFQQSEEQQQTKKQEQEVNVVPNLVASSATNNMQNSNITNTESSMDVETTESNDLNDDRKTFFRKIFAYRKKSSLRAKEKKIRQNRNLRKVILPKNALMALNEVKGVQIGDFVVNSIGVSGGFSALVTVNQTQYEGKGVSKAIAKNNACEKALRDFVISKMQQKPRRVHSQSSVGAEGMDFSESTIDNENTETNDTIDSNGGTLKSNDDSDVPMVNLASFALFKLFSEWESEGYHIPEFHNGSVGIQAGEKTNNSLENLSKKVTIKTELPNNWETLHPATLLCMMRPGLTYCNWGTEGERPNQIQSLSIAVDNEVFAGSGRSKKIARKNAAISACNKLFGTNFVKEG